MRFTRCDRGPVAVRVLGQHALKWRPASRRANKIVAWPDLIVALSTDDYADETLSSRDFQWSGMSVWRVSMSRQRLHILYTGRVQGVGFRYTTKTVACGFDVTGTVRNLSDGRVELCVEGERSELEEFRKAIQDSEVGRFVRHEETAWTEAKNEFRGFEIVR